MSLHVHDMSDNAHTVPVKRKAYGRTERENDLVLLRSYVLNGLTAVLSEERYESVVLLQCTTMLISKSI